MVDSPLQHVAIQTTLGAFYVFPDLTAEMVVELRQHLEAKTDNVVVRNISGAAMTVPRKIIELVGTLYDGPEIQPAHPTHPAPGVVVFWRKQ